MKDVKLRIRPARTQKQQGTEVLSAVLSGRTIQGKLGVNSVTGFTLHSCELLPTIRSASKYSLRVVPSYQCASTSLKDLSFSLWLQPFLRQAFWAHLLGSQHLAL